MHRTYMSFPVDRVCSQKNVLSTRRTKVSMINRKTQRDIKTFMAKNFELDMGHFEDRIVDGFSLKVVIFYKFFSPHMVFDNRFLVCCLVIGNISPLISFISLLLSLLSLTFRVLFASVDDLCKVFYEVSVQGPCQPISCTRTAEYDAWSNNVWQRNKSWHLTLISECIVAIWTNYAGNEIWKDWLQIGNGNQEWIGSIGESVTFEAADSYP